MGKTNGRDNSRIVTRDWWERNPHTAAGIGTAHFAVALWLVLEAYAKDHIIIAFIGFLSICGGFFMFMAGSFICSDVNKRLFSLVQAYEEMARMIKERK